MASGPDMRPGPDMSPDMRVDIRIYYICDPCVLQVTESLGGAWERANVVVNEVES